MLSSKSDLASSSSLMRGGVVSARMVCPMVRSTLTKETCRRGTCSSSLSRPIDAGAGEGVAAVDVVDDVGVDADRHLQVGMVDGDEDDGDLARERGLELTTEGTGQAAHLRVGLGARREGRGPARNAD
jgi:hypothetical protein